MIINLSNKVFYLFRKKNLTRKMVNSSFNVMQFYLWLTYQRNITFMKYILLKINIWDRIGTYFFLLFYFGWEKIQKWTQRFWGSLQNAVRLCFLNTRSKSSLVVGLKGIKSEVFFSFKTFWFFFHLFNTQFIFSSNVYPNLVFVGKFGTKSIDIARVAHDTFR